CHAVRELSERTGTGRDQILGKSCKSASLMANSSGSSPVSRSEKIRKFPVPPRFSHRPAGSSHHLSHHYGPRPLTRDPTANRSSDPESRNTKRRPVSTARLFQVLVKPAH